MEDKVLTEVNGEELFDIMCAFAEIEHNVRDFLIVLNALKDHYDIERLKDAYANTNVVIGYLTHLQDEFEKTISRMDEILLRNK